MLMGTSQSAGLGADGAAANLPSGMVTPVVAPGDCGNCGAARLAGERFCEVCGLDFETGRLPEAPLAAPLAAPPLGLPTPIGPAIGWTAVIRCDHAWWVHNNAAGGVASGVPFPDPVPAPIRVVLRGRSAVIGRSSGASVADIDCGRADSAVSRQHARLTLRDDGTWAVTDLGSTNGTFAGLALVPLAPQAETVLSPGDAVKLGAYTVIVLEADASAPS